jgi:hypothetical protein
MDAPRAPIITQIRGLKRLELHGPTRAILELLPEWLNHLSETLNEVHLKVNLHFIFLISPLENSRQQKSNVHAFQGNCGSITPGVLKALVSPLQQSKSNIRALSLGLSYSLTHDDTFQFLNKFPQLEELELRYYWVSAMPHVKLLLFSRERPNSN